MAMRTNQYTAFDIGPREGRVRYTLTLSAEDENLLSRLAGQVNREKSAAIRELVRWAAPIIDGYCQRYPEVKVWGIANGLRDWTEAAEARLQSEYAKEEQALIAYRQAQEKDGHQVNYMLTRQCLDLHHQAWKKGLSVGDLLENYAREKARVKAKYNLTDAELEPPEPENRQEPVAMAGEQIANVPQRNIDDWIFIDPRVLYLLAGSVVVLLVLLVIAVVLLYL